MTSIRKLLLTWVADAGNDSILRIDVDSADREAENEESD
jgi:hypothetical protein